MPPASGTLCVHCRRAPAVPEWRPFCSDRCRLLDLAHWVDGRYRIASEPESPDPDEPSPAEP